MYQMPRHHPNEERLVEYSAGGLHEPGSLVIATHLALCTECRAEVDRLEAVGGAMLGAIQPAALSTGALDTALANLDGHQSPPTVAPLPRVMSTTIPSPLSDYLGADMDLLDWKQRLGGVAEYVLPLGASPLKTFLLKMGAGRKLPFHTHRGYEMTLVLEGAYLDHMGEFRAGDFIELDGSVTHQPIITDEDDCICLAVTDAPLRFTSGIARLLNPFMKQ
jgi:putative transcriptional regulator